MIYSDAIKWAESELDKYQITVSFGRRLMLDLCELNEINLYMNLNEPMNEAFLKDYQLRVNRLCQNEPLAYVVGYEWFLNRPFKVDQRVLIPREETQELMGEMLMRMDELFDKDQPIAIVDIGTGSGCCGITLQLESAQPSRVTLTDISKDALDLAQLNAERLNCEAEVLCGDMAKPLIEHGLKFDVILCNPPYILDSEEVMSSVLEYEPHVALFGGEDGLKFYRSLLDDLPKIRKAKTLVGFEMGYQQQASLTKEIRARFPDAKLEFVKDMNGLDRMCFLTLSD